MFFFSSLDFLFSFFSFFLLLLLSSADDEDESLDDDGDLLLHLVLEGVLVDFLPPLHVAREAAFLTAEGILIDCARVAPLVAIANPAIECFWLFGLFNIVHCVCFLRA